MIQNCVTLIKDIGLEDKEARTYVALLEIGKGTAQQIATRADLKRTTVYPALERLLTFDLVRRDTIRLRTVFVSQPPSELIRFARTRFERLKDHAKDLEELTRSSRTKDIEELSFITHDDLRDAVCALITAYDGDRCVIDIGGKKYALVRAQDSETIEQK